MGFAQVANLVHLGPVTEMTKKEFKPTGKIKKSFEMPKHGGKMIKIIKI
jgi:hypothetical protein